MAEKGIISDLHRILRTISNDMTGDDHDNSKAPERFN